MEASTLLTKSDYRVFREAPRHLWARKNHRIEEGEGDQLLAVYGEQVEHFAKEYLEKVILPGRQNTILLWQENGSDDPYFARSDAILLNPESGAADIYEIKSSTKVKPEDLEDLAFQVLIFQKKYTIEHMHLVLVNSEYVFDGTFDLSRFIKVEDVTDQVKDLLEEVADLRAEAFKVLSCEDPSTLEHCWNPGDCSCPEICHPGLPSFSIYNIPRIGKDKKQQLEEMGVRAAKDVPTSFTLTTPQRAVVDMARHNKPVFDPADLRRELEKMQFPLYFLDYETCNLVLPAHTGYKPYQQMVFQYSLHVLDTPNGEPKHFEHLSSGDEDPALPLLASLKSAIGKKGTVLVWFAPFEKTRNKEMAGLHPQYADFLEDVNGRVYDLMEIVNKGLYLHPGFRGSASIKQVLPVMVPELSYDELEIGNGSKASWGWWRLMFSSMPEDERQSLKRAMLAYCKLDTLAMVEIYRKLSAEAGR